ncbi:MAG TPA: protease pro-enzyme activation domain-containing protein [Terriglobales bacterium]|nr:protease pro-enzyme activation domain-containing protein [Terriglobales bacterium]
MTFIPFARGKAAMQDRIPDGINNAQRVALHGTVHRLARPEFDQGSMPGSTVLEHMTLIFAPSTTQQQELNALIAAQQDRNSPLYHQWLSPEEFGARFGLSDADLAKVKDWLQQQGFTVTEVARSRNSMTFKGTVAQVQTALHTEIHRFDVQGVEHFANVSDPALPAAVANVVGTIRGLHDFHPHAHAVRPRFTSYVSGNHFITPDDFATIYDLKPLYQSGIDGTGQKIAVVGQTDIQQSDIDTFRSISGLPATNLTQQLDGTDPGTVSADLTEADLDIEWAGAVAPNAQIVYVRSTDAFESLRYAVYNSLAPVVSVSYGECETAAAGFNVPNPNGSGNVSDVVFLWDIGQQAATQGITVVAASGDSGAADCDPPSTSNETLATQGLSIDLPGGVPFVTAVGGTEFNDTSSPSQFWNSGNNVFQGSALSYIPESVWNTTAADNTMAAGGGGVSAQYTVANKCANGSGCGTSLAFQTGITPDGGTARDVPDVALVANVDRDGLVICSAGSCTNGYRQADTTLNIVGGTSAGTPSFAAMVALLNQMENSTGQGTLNPALYKLVGSAGFHDITQGDNKIPCKSGTTNCPTNPPTQNCPVFTAPPSGVSANNPCYGYAAGAGYDLASGLGSVDAYNLLTLMHTGSAPSAPADFSISGAPASINVTRGSGPATFTATFNATSGTPSPINVSCFVAGGANPQTVNGMTCMPSQTTVTSSGTQVTFTVTAASQVSSVRPAQPFEMPWSLAWTSLGAIVFCGGAAVRSRERRGLFAVFFSLTAMAAVIGLVSCGGGGSANGTPQNTGSQPAVSSISLSPSAVIGINSSSAAVTLASAAPSGGTAVSLSSNSAVASVPASVTIPAGSTTANFNISTTSVTTPTAVTISASTSGGSQTTTLNVANVAVVVQGSFDLRGGTQAQFGSTVHVAAVPVVLK